MKKTLDVVAALIRRQNKILICQRPIGKARALLWEFVGGKVERGETPQQALVRECKEELDLTVEVGNEFCRVTHEYDDVIVYLTLFLCTARGEPKLLEHNDMKWVLPSEINLYEFCPADEEILTKIQAEFNA